MEDAGSGLKESLDLLASTEKGRNGAMAASTRKIGDVPRLPLHLGEFRTESDAAWPPHFQKPAPCRLPVFDLGTAFSIPDKRSRGTEVLEGAYFPLRNPENPRN